MTTFKERPLCSLAFSSEAKSYEENLSALLSLVKKAPSNALIVFPEVAVTNFDYDHFEAAADYAAVITAALSAAAGERIIAATMIERGADGRIYNVAKVFHGGRVIHEQAKAELFKFGGEHDYFAAGDERGIVLFEADGLKIGIITPFGEERRNGEQLCLEENFSEKEVRKMRRYLDVGIV